MQPADPISITLSGATLLSLVTGLGGWFASTFFSGKSKPPKTACANCPYHDDHEKRIRALEASGARMEESIPDIRNALREMRDESREMKKMINAILLRICGAKANQ